MQQYVFGEDREEPLLDAMMASAALPPVFPPWSYKGRLFVDGGVVANVPVYGEGDLAFHDFSRTELLITKGRLAARAFLASRQPADRQEGPDLQAAA